MGTAEADEGGLFTFSWSVDSSAPILFGIFDTDGYITAIEFLTVETFQNKALVWGSLSGGIGYLEAPQFDDYFFLLLNPNESAEDVTTHVFMVTIAAIPHLDSAQNTTQATFSYEITSEDDYRVVVELHDGVYDVTFHSELEPKYPYQLYGIIIVVIGAVIAMAGFLTRARPQ